MTLRVTGNATPEELAAVVAVLATQGGPVEEPVPSAPSRWNDRAALLRRPLPTGTGAWRRARS